jgi:hypothetical protein
VQETERIPLGPLQPAPVLARGFEELEGAHHVGHHEIRRPVDRAIDVAFGGEVHDRLRPLLGEERVDQRAVGDVALHEAVARIALEARQVGGIAGIGELVEVHHRACLGAHPVEDEVGSDEARTAGDE